MPFDGNPGAAEHPAVAKAKWSDDPARLKQAAHELALELGRFERGLEPFKAGKVDAAALRRMRRVLVAAAEAGIVEREAAVRARRLVMVVWSIVALRFARPEPPYPKTHRAAAIAAHAERRAIWEQKMLATVRERQRLALKQLGVSDLSRLRAALSRGRGPRPTGLALAHRVYLALAQGSSRPLEPRATRQLTADLRDFLLDVARLAGVPKPLPKELLDR